MGLCPFCRSGASQRFQLAHTIVWKCAVSDCGLQFADPQLGETDLVRAYKERYYPSNGNGNGNAHVYENTPPEILRQTFEEVEAELGPLKGKSLLDFGCGVGGLCRVAGEYGIQATGIEPDANAREEVGKSCSLRAYASLGSLKEAQPHAKFDIVTMWDVIEHLREPWKDLEDLSSSLQPDGWLLLSTPNAACLRARVEGERWENVVNPTHFYYFTRRSLEVVLRRAGFSEIAELQFPIRYPGHARARRLIHRALVSCRLQGQLVFVARQKRLESPNCARGSGETRRTGAHAAD